MSKTSRLRASHVATLFHAMVSNHDTAAAWDFLKRLAKIAEKLRGRAEESQAKPKPIKLKAALTAYKKAAQAATGAWTSSAAAKEAVEAVKDEGGAGKEAIAASRAWLAEHGLPSPHITVNGQLIDELNLNRIMHLVSSDMRTIQGLVMSGAVTDSTNVYSTLLRKSFTVERYNEAVLGSEQVVSLATPDGAALIDAARFATSVDAVPVVHTSIFVVDDLSTASGLALARSAIEYLASDAESTVHARIAVVHAGSVGFGTMVAAYIARAVEVGTEYSRVCARVVCCWYEVIQWLTWCGCVCMRQNVLPFILRILDKAQSALDDGASSSDATTIEFQLQTLADGLKGKMSSAFGRVDQASPAFAAAQQASASAERVVAASPLASGAAIIANGRVLDPYSGPAMLAGDFGLLVNIDGRKVGVGLVAYCMVCQCS